MSDQALRLCAVRLHWFYDLTKPWLQNFKDEMEMVCMFIKYCLFQIVMLQKIRMQITF